MTTPRPHTYTTTSGAHGSTHRTFAELVDPKETPNVNIANQPSTTKAKKVCRQDEERGGRAGSGQTVLVDR